MQQKLIKDLIKEIAIKHKLSEDAITKIVRTPFEYTAYIMRNADKKKGWIPRIRLKYFLEFRCSEGRKNFYKQYYNNIENGKG